MCKKCPSRSQHAATVPCGFSPPGLLPQPVWPVHACPPPPLLKCKPALRQGCDEYIHTKRQLISFRVHAHTSRSTCILTLEKIQASGKEAVLRCFPRCLTSGHRKALPVCAAFLCRQLFTGTRASFLSSNQGVFHSAASGHFSGFWGLGGWACGWILVPGAHLLWKDHSGELLPGTLLCLLLAPPTLSQPVVSGLS